MPLKFFCAVVKLNDLCNQVQTNLGLTRVELDWIKCKLHTANLLLTIFRSIKLKNWQQILKVRPKEKIDLK